MRKSYAVPYSYVIEGKKQTIKRLYEKFDVHKICELEKERIDFLKETSKLVSFHKISPTKIDYEPIGIFANKLSTIMMNGSKLYKTKSKEENYLLFMFCIDPEFDAIGLYLTETDNKKMRESFKKRFGLFSPELLKTEIAYIKNVYTKEEQDEFSKRLRKSER